jgi:hypothetical protein
MRFGKGLLIRKSDKSKKLLNNSLSPGQSKDGRR